MKLCSTRTWYARFCGFIPYTFFAKEMARVSRRCFSLSLGLTTACKSKACNTLEICAGVMPSASKSAPFTLSSFKVSGAFSVFNFSNNSNQRAQVGAMDKSSMQAEKSACFNKSSFSKMG